MMGDSKPELLAPCGDWEAFLAAVENGADAVYMGGKLFNARQYASNFDKDKLEEAINYAHIRDVRVYLTLNTLISDSEMKAALDLIEEAYLAGIDGIIVQDIGLASLVREWFPDLSLHASTQMAIHSLEGVKMLERLGFDRVVLARELTLEEIKNIAQNTSLEIEVFVHGALCVSYSGQCLMSSMLGGRSGNRGKCAQPCRLPYKLTGSDWGERLKDSNKAYLLSPKDICLIEILDNIIKAGVRSLKIEGRMKSPEYVATVVRIYRKYLDRILDNPGNNDRTKIEQKDLKELAQAFNRGGFSRGYLEGKTGKDMISFEKPKNWGVYLGSVLSYDGASQTAKIRLEDELAMGDGIEVWNGEEKSPGTIVTKIRVKGRIVDEAKSHEIAEVSSVKGRIRKGNKVYKTSDKRLNSFARETFTGKFKRKVPIEGKLKIKKDEPLFITVKDYSGNEIQIDSGYIPEEAVNKPLTKEKILDQVRKTGQTPFEFRKIDVEVESNLAVPVRELNTIRRKALEQLQRKRADRYPERKHNWEQKIRSVSLLPKTRNEQSRKKALEVSACFYKNIEGLDYRTLNVDRLYLPFSMLVKEKKENILHLGESTEVYAYIPPITKGNYDKLIKSRLKYVVEMGIKGILVGNIGSVEYAAGFPGLSIMGDHPMNIFNSTSIKAVRGLGIDGVTLSPELNLNQMKEMEEFPGLTAEVLVYGRIPLMISEYCPVGSIRGGLCRGTKCSQECIGKDFKLRDRKNMEFPILCDRIDCRSMIFNSKVLLLADNIDKIKASGVGRIRLNFTDEELGEVVDIIDMHRELLIDDCKYRKVYGGLIEKIKERGFTKGHYFKGV
ncbi:MAG: U32 family peptidase [Clostridium sp.]|jgi:putative protease|nr:U32 family peptidase [Clostridium sp.]